jgi:hypothetical protein
MVIHHAKKVFTMRKRRNAIRIFSEEFLAELGGIKK